MSPSDSSPIILDPGFCIVTLTGIWRGESYLLIATHLSRSSNQFISGLAVVFAEDPDDVATNDPPNSEYLKDSWLIFLNSLSPTGDWSNLCPTYNANNPDTGLHGR